MAFFNNILLTWENQYNQITIGHKCNIMRSNLSYVSTSDTYTNLVLARSMSLIW